MTTHKLSAPGDIRDQIAGVFSAGSARIEVFEDRAFPAGKYWNLGLIVAKPEENTRDGLSLALSRGAYEWAVPSFDDAMAEIQGILHLAPPESANQSARDQYQKNVERLRRVMDAVAATAVRVGLIHPVFDPTSVEEMPFRRATTVVADTSGALQGGLDFVTRFLHPAARVKVPAVVHMEVVNQADSFLKRRRAAKVNASALLLDHIISQSGQRALLRIELREDTEVERTLLVGDPLRNAFQRDSDQEWAELNLSVPLRSYCDRLVKTSCPASKWSGFSKCSSSARLEGAMTV